MKKFKHKDFDYMLPHLRLSGVEEISFDFDGQGDSGEISDPEADGFNFNQLCPGKKDSYSDMLINAADQYLRETNLDWYNNDGGYGTITFDLLARRITADVHIRITNTEDHAFKDRF